MRKTSLFIGRWQPFHRGHKKLIDTALKEGKRVVIALRDTPINDCNPFTIKERKEMIRAVYGDLVQIIVIPDIDEVCYGRKVGYDIRKIKLDSEIEKISATKIRDYLDNWQFGGRQDYLSRMFEN